MSSFVYKILLHKKEDTLLGDLARDILQDPNINRKWNFKKLFEYLQNHNACERCLNECIDFNNHSIQTSFS
jgi:hypothetical protein